ncbi:MAG: methyltransferase domain-containing protein [Alphaproteobacteria bacterium]
MQNSDRAFSGSIPALYDRYLGPLIFEAYAADLARRLPESGAVLETAAGTGIVTAALLGTLPPTARLVATDLNQAMLDHAATKMKAPNLAWRQADATALPFEDRSFDAVVCQFGVMFFPDKRKAHEEVRRVLKPGGRYLFNVWDRLEFNDFGRVVHEAVVGCYPSDPPGFLARAPYGYADPAAVTDAVRAAGFERVEIESLAFQSRAPSSRDPAIGFCQGSPLRAEIEARKTKTLDEVTDAAADAIAARFGRGPIEGRIRAHVVTAMR